jgi:hypothetical protein
LVVGDTFVGQADPPAELFERERRGIAILAPLLASLQPIAIVRGPADLALQRLAIESAGKEARLPLLAGPTTLQARARIDSVLWGSGGLKIGVIGTPGSAAAETNGYSAVAAALRAQGADIVIALVPESVSDAESLMPRLSRMDVVIAGGSDEPVAPRAVFGKALLAAGKEGRHLGILELHKRGETPGWVLDTRSAAAAAAHPEEVPPGSYVTFSVESMSAAVPVAPWAKERHQELAAICAPAPAPAATP